MIRQPESKISDSDNIVDESHKINENNGAITIDETHAESDEKSKHEVDFDDHFNEQNNEIEDGLEDIGNDITNSNNNEDENSLPSNDPSPRKHSLTSITSSTEEVGDNKIDGEQTNEKEAFDENKGNKVCHTFTMTTT